MGNISVRVSAYGPQLDILKNIQATDTQVWWDTNGAHHLLNQGSQEAQLCALWRGLYYMYS